MRIKNYILFTTCLLAYSFVLQAYDNSWMLDTDIYFRNGYRQDKLTTLASINDPWDEISASEEIKAENIELYQLGFQCKWALCQYFFRLEADYGWSHQGKFQEVASNFGGKPSIIKGGLNSAITRDCIFGGGYQFTVCKLLLIGPAVGWSYQHLQFRSSCNQQRVYSFYDKIKYVNRWQGPWVGIDASFFLFPLTLNGGYEYHSAHWHAKWRRTDHDYYRHDSYDRLQSNRAYGQVIYLETRWDFCNYVNLGVGMKYQLWKVPKGDNSHNRYYAIQTINRVSWRSLLLSVDLGVTF